MATGADERERQMHDHDRGLQFDVSTLMTRRRALQLVAVGGLAAVAGCGSSSNGSAGAASTAAAPGETAPTTGSAAGGTAEIPEETAGPFPADGSNGVNVLAESGIVRSDITSSFGSASGAAEGVQLSIALTVLDVSAGGAPVEGAAVYLWHCDRDGRYSLYDSEDACREVYATAGYEQSAQNLAQTSLTTDMVFADGYSTQLGTAGGSPGAGMTIALNVGV